MQSFPWETHSIALLTVERPEPKLAALVHIPGLWSRFLFTVL